MHVSHTMSLLELAGAVVLTFCVMQVFDLPPLRSWRLGRLFALGIAGAALTAFLGFIFYELATSSSLVVEFGGIGLCLLQMALIGAIAFSVWAAFWRVLNDRVSRK
jgi:hypothetical protein